MISYCAWLIVVLVAFTGCTTVGPRSARPEIVRLDGTRTTPAILTERIEELMCAAQVQGLTVTIFNDAEKVYSRAFGFANLMDGQPLQLNTEFYGASLSKAVFAVLVMKLVEQGVIDLDTPLQEYLDEPLWKNKGKAWHE